MTTTPGLRSTPAPARYHGHRAPPQDRQARSGSRLASLPSGATLPQHLLPLLRPRRRRTRLEAIQVVVGAGSDVQGRRFIYPSHALPEPKLTRSLLNSQEISQKHLFKHTYFHAEKEEGRLALFLKTVRASSTGELRPVDLFNVPSFTSDVIPQSRILLRPSPDLIRLRSCTLHTDRPVSAACSLPSQIRLVAPKKIPDQFNPVRPPRDTSSDLRSHPTLWRSNLPMLGNPIWACKFCFSTARRFSRPTDPRSSTSTSTTRP